MSQASLLKSLKNLIGKKTVARFENTEGDRYVGLLRMAGPNGFLFQEFSDLRADGLQFWPLESLRKLTVRKNDALFYKLIQQNGELKRSPQPTWTKDVHDLPEILEACKRRSLWPVVELRKTGGSGLYLGPIQEVGETHFKQKAYDADGRWEKAYDLRLDDVIRVEILDFYSTTFNAYMKKRR